jgi:hypothetical protein
MGRAVSIGSIEARKILQWRGVLGGRMGDGNMSTTAIALLVAWAVSQSERTGPVFLVGSQMAELLKNPTVQKELQATQQSVSALQQSLRQSDAEVASASADQAYKHSLEQAEKSVTSQLNADAWKRLRQLHWQAIGIAAALRRDEVVRKELDVDDALMSRLSAQFRNQARPPISLSINDVQSALRKIRDERDAMVMKALSEEQKSRWVRLIGPQLDTPLDPPVPSLNLSSSVVPFPKPTWPRVMPGETMAKALDRQDIRQELGLGTRPLEEIKKFQARLRSGDAALKQQHEKLTSDKIPSLLELRRRELLAELATHFSPQASRRWRQLELQTAGLFILLSSDAEIESKLGIMPEQKRRLDEMVLNGTIRRPPPLSSDVQSRRDALRAFRKETDALVIEKILSDQQRMKWAECVGPPAQVDLLDLVSSESDRGPQKFK